MTELAKRLATYEDLLALPEGVRGEIVAGERSCAARSSAAAVAPAAGG